MTRTAKPSAATFAPTALDFLRRPGAAENLIPTAERFLQLQHELEKLVPDGVAQGLSVCRFEDGNLVLAVPAASTASKLRQTFPRLRAGLESQGWKVSSIQVRVQPEQSTANSTTYEQGDARQNEMGRSLEHWSALEQNLAEGTLKNSVSRLIARQRRKID